MELIMIIKRFVILTYIHDMCTSQPVIQAARVYYNNKVVHHQEFDGAVYETEAKAYAALEEFGINRGSKYSRDWYVIQPIYYKR
jgi:hypothetical protein